MSSLLRIHQRSYIPQMTSLRIYVYAVLGDFRLILLVLSRTKLPIAYCTPMRQSQLVRSLALVSNA